METKVAYIDDNIQDQKKYKMRFTNDARSMGKFRLETFNAPKSPDAYDRIGDANPDLLLVDYDLDIPENGNVIGISGVALSTELRRKFPEVPIVLFTRKSVFGLQNYVSTREKLSNIIDEIIYKQEMFEQGSSKLEDIYRLADGYRILKNQTDRSWSSLLALMGATKSDEILMEQSNPPFPDIDRWVPSSLAVWVRDILLRFPGILYDAVHAATLLGISKEAFLSEDVQGTLASARYNGIFEPTEGRWWKSKIQSNAYSIMSKKEKSAPLREGFPRAWERIKGEAIDRSKCVFSGESPADWVCHILKKPVLIKYSLSYTVDNRPSVMDEARISFEAIRTTNDWDEKRVDPVGRELIPKIRNMAKPGS